MHKIKLDVTSFTENGTAHAQLYIDNKDVGLLYLSEDERELLLEVLTRGGNNLDDISVESTQEEPPEEVDLDIF